MKMKKITAFLCALVLAGSAAANAFAAENTDWPQFLGSPEAAGITAAPTPSAASAVRLDWSVKYTATSEFSGTKFENNACGTPIAVGDFLYFTVSDGRLLKLNAATGKVAATASVSGIPPYFSQIAYGDGKIYVPRQTAGGVTVSAFDAASLSPVWQGEEIALGASPQQIASPLTYYNGRLYFGTYTQDAKTYAYTSGVYACLDTKTGRAAWRQPNETAGYYWNGGTVVGSAVAVADTNGTITSYGLTDGKKIASVSAGGPVGSTLCYAQGRIFASVKKGFIYSVKADTAGMLYGSTEVKSTPLGNGITSSPVVYNGRLYVAGGGYGATAPFSVLDASTLSVIYQIKAIHSQSSPLLTTAYAQGGKGKVSVYVADYGVANQDGSFEKGSSRVYVISDAPGQSKPSYETLFTPSIAQSSSQSLVPSRAGRLYYFNDSGTMYAIGKAAPLASPKTGETPDSAVFLLLAFSGGAVFLLKRKMKQAA